MQSTFRRPFVQATVLVSAFAMLLTACGVRSTPEAVAARPVDRNHDASVAAAPFDGPTASSAPAAPATVQPAKPAKPAQRPAEKPVLRSAEKPPPGFAWTAQPRVGDAPAKGLVGYAGGRRFAPGAVVFEYGADGWHLIVATKPPADPTAPIQEGEFISLDLPQPPAANQTQTRPMRPGGGFWRIADPESPGDFANWTAPNAWQVKVTGWTAKPYRRGGPVAQVVGTASGRLAVTFKGNQRTPDAWLAGSFTKATVRYLVAP